MMQTTTDTAPLTRFDAAERLAEYAVAEAETALREARETAKAYPASKAARELVLLCKHQLERRRLALLSIRALIGASGEV